MDRMQEKQWVVKGLKLFPGLRTLYGRAKTHYSANRGNAEWLYPNSFVCVYESFILSLCRYAKEHDAAKYFGDAISNESHQKVITFSNELTRKLDQIDAEVHESKRHLKIKHRKLPLHCYFQE